MRPPVPADGAPVRQCWCHAVYGQLRAATQPGGLCLVCVLIPGLCEAGHQHVAGSPSLMALERERGTA